MTFFPRTSLLNGIIATWVPYTSIPAHRAEGSSTFYGVGGWVDGLVRGERGGSNELVF